MKKYRLTKITIKTREVISLSKNSTGETKSSVCPTYHTTISIELPQGINSGAEGKERLTRFLPAENSQD